MGTTRCGKCWKCTPTFCSLDSESKTRQTSLSSRRPVTTSSIISLFDQHQGYHGPTLAQPTSHLFLHITHVHRPFFINTSYDPLPLVFSVVKHTSNAGRGQGGQNTGEKSRQSDLGDITGTTRSELRKHTNLGTEGSNVAETLLFKVSIAPKPKKGLERKLTQTA